MKTMPTNYLQAAKYLREILDAHGVIYDYCHTHKQSIEFKCYVYGYSDVYDLIRYNQYTNGKWCLIDPADNVYELTIDTLKAWLCYDRYSSYANCLDFSYNI